MPRRSSTRKSKSRTSTKRASSVRKSGKPKKRAYRKCLSADNLPLNWFRDIMPHQAGKPKRNIQDEYKAMGVRTCDDFKAEAVPCRFLPRHKVGAYAARCGIKGRSKKSQKTLCSKLRRRNKLRPFSKRCVNRRLLDLVTLVDRPLESLKMVALRRVLKSGDVVVPFRHPTKLQLRDLIIANRDQIRRAQA
jgi:hypothetical protein